MVRRTSSLDVGIFRFYSCKVQVVRTFEKQIRFFLEQDRIPTKEAVAITFHAGGCFRWAASGNSV